jgi:5-methyltetrahydrofolate--homocysteine methyltransferase
MLIIGERINSTRRPIQRAIEKRNESLILKEAKSQIEAGASFLDVNCAMGLDNEIEDIDWVISVIRSEFDDIGISVDTPHYPAMAAALKACKGGGGIFINSITGEEARMKSVIPLAVKFSAKVIALVMDGRGMPASKSDRVEIAAKILSFARKEGLKEEDLYFDPLVRPLSCEPEQVRAFLDSIGPIKGLGGAKTICGLSNVSFGLPNRSLLNSAFLTMVIASGMDACILDPLDPLIISSLRATEALLGKDEYCAAYLKSYRQKRLVSA